MDNRSGPPSEAPRTPTPPVAIAPPVAPVHRAPPGVDIVQFVAERLGLNQDAAVGFNQHFRASLRLLSEARQARNAPAVAPVQVVDQRGMTPDAAAEFKHHVHEAARVFAAAHIAARRAAAPAPVVEDQGSLDPSVQRTDSADDLT